MCKIRFGILLWVMVATTYASVAAEPLRIFAAGSLTAAFTDMVNAFPSEAGAIAPPVFGPSGLLRERIEHGEPADLLASADMVQPRILARERNDRARELASRKITCFRSCWIRPSGSPRRPRTPIPAETTHGLFSPAPISFIPGPN